MVLSAAEWYRDTNGRARWTGTNAFAKKVEIDPLREVDPPPAKRAALPPRVTPAAFPADKPLTRAEGLAVEASERQWPALAEPQAPPPPAGAAMDAADAPPPPPAAPSDELPDATNPDAGEPWNHDESNGPGEGPPRPAEGSTPPPPPPPVEAPPVDAPTGPTEPVKMDDQMAQMAGHAMATGWGMLLTRLSSIGKTGPAAIRPAEHEALAGAWTAVVVRYMPALQTNHPELWTLAAVSAGVCVIRVTGQLPPDPVEEPAPKGKEPQEREPNQAKDAGGQPAAHDAATERAEGTADEQSAEKDGAPNSDEAAPHLIGLA